MPDLFTITYHAGITLIKVQKKLTYDEVIEMLDVIAKHHPYKKRLFDLTESGFDLSTQEIEALANHSKQLFPEPNRSATVVNDDLSFGEMRQFAVYRFEEHHAEQVAFRNLQDAIEWLNSD